MRPFRRCCHVHPAWFGLVWDTGPSATPTSHTTDHCQIGFDAVLYTDTPALVSDLRRRGVRFNY